MPFILVVDDEIAKDNVGEYEFDTLKEAKEFAKDLISIEKINGKRHRYSLLDNENTSYDIEV